MRYFEIDKWQQNKDLAFVDYTTVLTISDRSHKKTTVYYEDETKNEAFLSIGRFCSIATGVQFYLGGNHNSKRVTTRLPLSQLTHDKNSKNLLTKGNINIQNDVWFGDSSIVLSGVIIGNGSIVGTRAVITKDIEPYSVVVGNPAVVVKKRFDDKTIEKMQKYQWWNWKDSVIVKHSEKIISEDIERFFDLCEQIYEDKANYLKFD